MVVNACLSQFDNVASVRHLWPMVRSEGHLGRVLDEIARRHLAPPEVPEVSGVPVVPAGPDGRRVGRRTKQAQARDTVEAAGSTRFGRGDLRQNSDNPPNRTARQTSAAAC